MSEKDTQSDPESDGRVDDTIGETAPEAAREQVSDPERPAASSESNDRPSPSDPAGSKPPSAGSAPGRGPAWVALVFSLLAVLGVAWLFVQHGTNDDPSDQNAATEFLTTLQSGLAAIERRVAAAESALVDTERALQTLDSIADDRAETRALIDRLHNELSERIDQLDAGLLAVAPSADVQPEAMAARIDALNQRFEALETSQSDLEAGVAQLDSSLRQQQGQQRTVDRDLALKLDLLEASALLALGQARVELVGDRVAAVAAYELASTRIANADDPRLTQVRERLADELARIEAIEHPDWLALGARLAQWEQQVAEWPLGLDEGASAGSGSEPAQESAEQGWLSGMRQSLGQLVTVERRDPLALDEELISAVREQARLNLAAAGLALERRDLEAMRLRLSHVIELIDAHFQLDDDRLADVRSSMVEMVNLQPGSAPDDLGQAAAALDRVIDSL
jgi:uroporphyrin-3 C-methyltransferase